MKLREAMEYLKPYRRQMVWIVLLAVGIAVLSAVTPFFSQRMIDRGILARDLSRVIQYVLMLLLLEILSRGIEYLQHRCEIQVSNSLGEDLKTKAFEHGLKLRPSYYKDNNFYKTMSDALLDISNLLMIADNSFLTIVVVAFKCVGASVGLFLLDWRLALLVLATIPMKYAINRWMKNRAEALSRTSMEKNRAFNTWYSNVIGGIRDIKLWGLELDMQKTFRKHTQQINKAEKRFRLLNAANGSLSQLLSMILTYLLYIVGAWLITREDLTFGGLVAFLSFTAYVLLPVDVIMNLGILLKQIGPHAEGINRFYTLKEEAYDIPSRISGPIETIEFRNVSVCFDGREVLQHVNLTASRGETIAIIGENGSGKTTLMNLLLQLVLPTEGNLFINSVPATRINIADYRKRFSVVAQDLHLFQGTVRENVQLTREVFSEKTAPAFCREAVERLTQGWDTSIGSEGLKLSGGERQKLALLRALYRPSDILILDEPTVHYDVDSKKQFYEFLENEQAYGFCFVVTHEMEALKKMDQIWRVGNGIVTVERVKEE